MTHVEQVLCRYHFETGNLNKAEQNGCRERLEWQRSCHRRLALAVA